MRRAADEIDRAVTQRRIGLVDREDHFERHIETLGFEESELDRSFGREIRVRDHVGDGEFHGSSSSLACESGTICAERGDNRWLWRAPPSRHKRRGRTMIAAASLTTRWASRR